MRNQNEEKTILISHLPNEQSQLDQGWTHTYKPLDKDLQMMSVFLVALYHNHKGKSLSTVPTPVTLFIIFSRW